MNLMIITEVIPKGSQNALNTTTLDSALPTLYPTINMRIMAL